MLQDLANASELSLISGVILTFICSGVFIVWFCTNPRTHKMLIPFEGVVPPFVAVPAGIFALTAALMAASLWENYSGAAKAIRTEVQGLESCVELSQTIPALKATDLATLSRVYARSVVTDEWTSMAAMQDSTATEEKFKELQLAIFQVASSLNNAAETKVLLSAYQNIQDGRSARMSYMNFDTHPARWIAVMILGLMLQLAVGAVHLTKPKALMIAMPIVTCTILTALCTIMLTLSNPYVGWLSVESIPYLPLLR